MTARVLDCTLAVLSNRDDFRLGPLLVTVDGKPWTAHSDGWVIFAAKGQPVGPLDTSEHATPNAVANVQKWLNEDTPNTIAGDTLARFLADLHCSRCDDMETYPCACESGCDDCDGNRTLTCYHYGYTYGRTGGIPFNFGLTRKLPNELLRGPIAVGIHRELNYGKPRAKKLNTARLLLVGRSWRFVQCALRADSTPRDVWHDLEVFR